MKRRLLNTLCLLIVGSFATFGVRADTSFLRYSPLLGVTSSPEPKAVLSTDGKTLRLVYDSTNYGDEDADWFPIREGYLSVGGLSSSTGILYGHMRELDAYLYAYNIEKIVIDSSFSAYRPTRAFGWFVGFPSLTSIEGLANFNTSQITDMSYMFYNCSKVTSLDLSGWNTSNVTKMYEMFYYCQSLMSLDVSGWDTSNVTTMYMMFYHCSSLKSLDVSCWDTSKVSTMYEMFYYCSSLTSLDLSSWNTSNVTTMYEMFGNCLSLTSLDLSGWDTSKLTNMSWMFYYCQSLTTLDLSSFSTPKLQNLSYAFYYCTGLKRIYVSERFTCVSVTSGSSAFYYCQKLVGGAGTAYDSSNYSHTYARIDAPDAPGYFTAKPGFSPYSILFVDGVTGNDANDGCSTNCPKKTIAAAIAAVKAGGRVYVTTGVYGPISSDNKDVSIRAWKRSGEVVIDGGNSQRCATLGNSSNEWATVLRGFVLRNGKAGPYQCGGGVIGGVVEDCVISNCVAGTGGDGGGAALCRLSDSQVMNCSAVSGGGIVGSTATHCRIVGCTADQSGGAASGSTLDNCLVCANNAKTFAGLYDCFASNCTIVDNYDPAGMRIGHSTLANCIVYPVAKNPNGVDGNALHNCYYQDPSFRDAANGDYRLAYGSPCVNAGDNAYVTCATDLAGRQRVDDFVVDIGCYELRDYLKALDYAGASGSLVFNDNKDSDWLVDTTVSVYGGSSVKSVTGAGVTMKVVGPGELKFKWKVDCYPYYYYSSGCLQCSVDGVQKDILWGNSGWETVALYLEGTGTHTVKLQFVLNSSYSGYANCGWIDQLSWTPNVTNPHPEVRSAISSDVKWNYTVQDGKASVGSGIEGWPAVPPSINTYYYYYSLNFPSSLGGYTVNAIGDYAFNGCTNLYYLSLSSQITKIGKGAFKDCANLYRFTLPAKLVSIGDSAFEGCSLLPSLRIPTNGVTSVGAKAFYGCSNLESLAFPATVTTCGADVLSGCSSMREIVLHTPLANVLRYTGCPNLKTIRYYGTEAFPSGDFGSGHDDVTIYVRRDSTGWGVPIPGTWCGYKIDYLDALAEQQLSALDFTGEGTWSDDGAPFWTVEALSSATNGTALRSSRVACGETSSVKLTVEGKGTLSFRWRGSSYYYDYLYCYIDGVQYGYISSSSSWQEVVVDIASEGAHVIEWRYSNNHSDAYPPSSYYYSDYGHVWLDKVTWSSGAGVLGKDVLLWSPNSSSSSSQVSALITKLKNTLQTAYKTKIPGDARYAASYPDGIKVDLSSSSSLPGRLSNYALVFVILPYYEITDADVARLKTVVDRGGRVVLQAEHALFSATENANLTQLAADMGADFKILTGQKAGADTYNTSCNILSKPTLLTQLPESKSVAPISYSGVAQEVARLSNDSSFVWAVDEASGNGRITVFSDNNWYCDSGTSSGTLYEDAIPLLERLLSNAIENEQKVLDEEDPNADIEEEIPDWAVAAVRDNNSLLTYYSNVVSACTAASQGLAVSNRLTVVLKKDVIENFQLPEGVTFETTGITSNYTGEISVPSGCELVVNATHDVYKSVSVHPPEAPSVTASQGTYTNRVEISWSVPNSEKPITAYEVKRISSGGLETLLSSSVKGTSYSDTSARSGIHYTYYVRAQSSAGWGFAGSAEGWRSTSGQAPDPVLEVEATAGTETNGVVVTWQPDTNSAIAVTHYQVRRAPKGTDDWTTLSSTVDPSAASFTDTTADGGVEYVYEVLAGNDNGWSSGVKSDGSGWIPVALSLDPSFLAVSVEGGTQTVAVIANAGWSVASVDGNVTPVVTNGTTLTIDVPANPSQSAKTNTVTVTAGTDHPVVATLTVVQARQPKLTGLEVSGPGTLEGGSVSNFIAIATYDDGTERDVTSEVTWLAEPPLNGSITSNGVFTAVEFVDSNRLSRVSASLTQVGDETVTLTDSLDVTILPVVWDTYEQVVNPNFETDFTFTRGINPKGGVAVFVDTNEPVEGSKRAIVAGTSYTIKWPDGFKYYDGKTYDLYFKMIPRNSANPWSWAFEFQVIEGKECILGPGSLVANKNFDMEVWLQDGEKAVTDIDLIGGSCYTGYEEGARPYSDNGKIYTNVPNPSSFWRWDPAESCWSPSSSAYDTPNYFILGHGTTPEGHLKGGYKGHPGSCGGEFVFGYITKDVTFRAEYADGASAPAKFSYETNTAVFAKNVLRIPLDRRISVLPTVELPHQHVDHWYLGSDRTKPLTSEALKDVCVTDNLTVTAVMATNQFTITFSPADDSRDETVNGRPFAPTDVVVTYGDVVSDVPQVEKPYARLLGWSTNMTASIPEHPLSDLSGLQTLADEHGAKIVLYSIWVPYYPVSLWLEGPTHGAVGVAEEYHAFAAFADATTNEVTLDASTTWSVVPTNKSTCVKTKSAFELTPRVPGETLVLSATYVYGTNTVSGSLAVTVPEIVTLPIALDLEDADISTGGAFRVIQYNLNFSPQTIAQCENAIANPKTWITAPVTGNYPTISFEDGKSVTGRTAFLDTVSFPGNIGGKHEYFVCLITGKMLIPEAGDWTFACDIDDGFQFELTGHGAAYVFDQDGIGELRTRLKTFHIAQTGIYDIRAIFYEQGGYAGLSMAAAKGVHTKFDASVFKVIGTASSEIKVIPLGKKSDLVIATGGTAGVGNDWYGQLATSHDGIDAGRSGWIFGAGESWMSTTVTNAGDVSFWWKASCEPTYDSLTFAVDGGVRAQTSGTSNGWQKLSFEIPGGTHTLSWTYAKDGRNDVGEDCGWVDQLVWNPLPAPSATTGGVACASIRASDGTSADFIEVEWSPFDSRRPVLEYELSRAEKGTSDWTVLSTSGALRFVDVSAEPGVDYTYRVRARNDAGWGEWVSDDGWRAYALSVGATEIEVGCGATTNDLPVGANADWKIDGGSGDWLTVEKATATNATLAVAENDSLDARTGTVAVSVGGTSPHATNVVITVTQSGRPPRMDVGFVKPFEDWRTRLQVTTNLEDNAYAPVSVFSAADPLEIGFGWTNRSEVAVSVPPVCFRLYVPDVAEPVAEWTVEGRADEALAPGEGAWSGGWPFEVLAALRPGDYRLEAELAPDMDDLNREGDLDSDENDNIAIFRFAVRDVALDAFRDVFAEFDFTNVEFMVGNDFAQEPHAANRDATCTWTGGTSHVTGVLPSIQFGPYVPMNGKIGRTVRGKAPLDLVFLIDVTGSMSGCINGLKANIREFFKTLVEGDADHAPITDWRAKVIGYRDYTCDYSWYEDHGFTTDVGAFNSHIASCVATGGGDGPESLLDAVWRIAEETEFREDASRAVVAFTDAPYKTPMSYGGAKGKVWTEVSDAAKAAGINLQLVAAPYADSDNLKKFAESVSTNSSYIKVSNLSTSTLNGDMLRSLAKTVSSGVRETKVVEPMLSCSTRGYGTLSFDWKNDAIDGTNNTFRFECASVTNIANAAGTGWQHVELELKEGWHLFQWTYGKRDYRGLVSDCGVVANLTWEPYATKLDIQPATLPADYTGLALPPHDVTVTNFDGRAVTSNDYCVAYSNREEQVDLGGTVTNTIFTYGGKFKVDCNSCWKVVEADDWLKPIIGEGDGNGELIVEIGENTNYVQRTGFITVRAGEYGLPSDLILEKTVKVVQERHPYIPGPDPQILTVDVKPRWPWSEIVDIDFEVILPQSGKPVSATFRGLNLEGGDVRKDYVQMEGSRKSWADPKYDGTLWGATVSKNDVTANCPSSGIYRVSWNMAKSGTWESSDYWGTKGDSFHTPEFAVALKAKADGCNAQNATSRTVRVDLRQDLCGGRIISGTERIGHPTGYIDPVMCDSTSMSNGWNCLDAYYVTGEGDATTNYLDDAFTAQDNNKTGYTNRFDCACVINDACVEGGLIVTNTVWRPDRVHVVRDNVYVDPLATLTIADGTVVKFCRATRLFIHKFKAGSYNLVVQGAYFTVAQDAYYGGDTLRLNAQSRDNSGWDLGQRYVVSQNMIYTSELNANASSASGHAIASVTLYCPPIDPLTGKYGEDSYSSSATNRESKAYAVRYYTRGQQWGFLPRPTSDGTEFYGWFNDRNGLTANWLNTDGYVDRTSYPSAVATYAVDGEMLMDFTKNFNTTIYGLVLGTNYFGSAGNLCPRSNAGDGQIVLGPERGVYDGNLHSPAIRSFTVADANVPASTYDTVYGPGNFTTAGVYAVSAEFRSDYTNAPTVNFVVEPRPIEGGEILFSNPTNGVMYLPGLKKPDVTVHLPEYKGSGIDDVIATRDAEITNVVSTDPEGHVWPEVGEYRVVASYEGNPNYTGGALTNVFRVSVNPDYVFTEYETLEEALSHASDTKYAGRTPRIIRFSGRARDLLLNGWKDLIRGNTKLNDFVATNFVCWADTTNAAPSFGVRSLKDDQRDILTADGVMTVAELLKFFQDALAAPELPTDVSGAELTLSCSALAYDGTVRRPSVTVKLDGDEILPGNYELVWSGDGVELGTYTVYARFDGSAYVGETAVVSYEVVPRALKAVSLDPESAVYDGTMHKPTVGTDGIPCAVDYGTGDFAAVGDYPITVTASGNCTGTVTKVFKVFSREVIGAEIELDATSAEVKRTKSGALVDVRPHVISVHDASHAYGEGTDYDVLYSEPTFTTAGVYTVSAVFKGGYSGRASVMFEVTEATEEAEATVAILGDDEAVVVPDGDQITVRPSGKVTAVVVNVPDGVDKTKVTVELSAEVKSVKPNGVKVKVLGQKDAMGVAHDITALLDLPAADADGVIDLTKATVIEEVLEEILDPKEKDTVIDLGDPDNPELQTVTRKGLFYQLFEGRDLGAMAGGDSTVGDGTPWAPEISVKGGKSAFYRIGVAPRGK